MGKKNKSKEQIDLLMSYYQQKPHVWSKKDLAQMSKKTGLKKHQVYKWLWDQRNGSKSQNQLIQQNIRDNGKDDIIERQNNLERGTNVTLISQKFNVKASLPIGLESPQYIRISTQTSEWAQKILVNKGWQLIRLLNQSKKNVKKIVMFDVVDEKQGEKQVVQTFKKEKMNQQ